MKNKKTIITTVGAVLVLAVGLWLVMADNPGNEPTTPGVDTTGWQTYENEKYGFSLRHPDDWEVAEATDDPNGPIFNIYQPDEVENEPPFIHHSAETHVSVFPQGIPTEGFMGETTDTNVDFQVPTNEVRDYVLADGTHFATYANVGAVTNGWNEAGFLFSHTSIDNLETECRQDGEVIPEGQCDVLMGDTIVRYGEIDEEIRAQQVQILESFELTD